MTLAQCGLLVISPTCQERSAAGALRETELRGAEFIKQGSAAAQFSLGSIYAAGTGSLVKDAARAATLFRSAAEQGHIMAQKKLAHAYLNGAGVPTDAQQGLRWLECAGDAGDAEAQSLVGTHYALGLGVHRDLVLGARWSLRAAAQGWMGARHTANWCQQQLLVQVCVRVWGLCRLHHSHAQAFE
jgi:TPR repeat protein